MQQDQPTSDPKKQPVKDPPADDQKVAPVQDPPRDPADDKGPFEVIRTDVYPGPSGPL